jgi:hypothetical protein
LSSLSAQRIIARGIDNVIVGEIFHNAMRESDVPQQGDHISCELFLAKESASRFFHYKSSACPTNAPGNDAWRTKINSQKVLYRTALGGGMV